MTKDEALRMALEALHGFIPYLPLKDEAQCGRYDQAITAIKEALEVKRTWVGLTPEEVKEISLANRPYVVDMVVALEARLKEKNDIPE